METPNLTHLTALNYDYIYEPAEDTFLMMDALEQELTFIKSLRPSVVVEVCSGTGAIGTALCRALGSSSFFISTDINDLACKASSDTYTLNGVDSFEVICADLLSCLSSGVVDVLICNPPYVPTSEEEFRASDKLSLSWAGGENGRNVMDRLFKDVPRLLSSTGVFYLLVLKENRPSEIMDIFLNYGFNSKVIVTRKAGREHLSVLRFSKHEQWTFNQNYN